MRLTPHTPLTMALAISVANLPSLAGSPSAASILAAPPGPDSPAQKKALADLTERVRQVAAPGLTGAVATFGPNAFPVLGGLSGKTSMRPVEAAAFAGKARVVAFGHNGFLSETELAKGDTAQLVKNALTWVSGGTAPQKIGVIAGDVDPGGALQKLGFQPEAVTTGQLEGISTLVVDGQNLKSKDLEPLRAYLAKGGGLVIATTGWGWQGEVPGADFANQYVGNQLLAPYGLVWTTGTVRPTFEIGHNHQQADRTFQGTGEVTNNLLPLYVWTTLLGHDIDSAHPSLGPANFAVKWARYDGAGHKFEDWQRDPFLALQMYIQLQKAFGWEPFKKTFSEYRTLTGNQHPKSEEGKHDQWRVRMSRNTGHNLGPFFEKWGVPTSSAARESIGGLPAWMPKFPEVSVKS